jgi:hypothetical protein
MGSTRSAWMATLVGTIVGVGGWFFGLGRIFWPAHPQWALFLATLGATILTKIIVDENARRNLPRSSS